MTVLARRYMSESNGLKVRKDAYDLGGDILLTIGRGLGNIHDRFSSQFFTHEVWIDVAGGFALSLDMQVKRLMEANENS